jgi:hypothetical protein
LGIKQLPDYALSVFVRVAKQADITVTFKKMAIVPMPALMP